MDFKLVVVSVVIGLAIGSSGTYVAMRNPVTVAVSDSNAETPSLQLPSLAEATAAVNEANRHNPLNYGTPKPVSIELGQCGANALGPGVACMTTIHKPEASVPLNRQVGFARNAQGQWTAILY
jgi:hypothetical protein